MQWLECTVPGGNDPDGVCARLAEAGVGGMSVEDEAEFREFLAAGAVERVPERDAHIVEERKGRRAREFLVGAVLGNFPARNV